MTKIGILAYGSLIFDPGREITEATEERIKDIITPFKVEFARSSTKRGGAPTLIPVDIGGANVKAHLFLLKDSISEDSAKDMLWRRETHQFQKRNKYKHPTEIGKNTIIIEQLNNVWNFDIVFYTKVGTNIEPLTAENLAKFAIESARSEAGNRGLDGISYLMQAKYSGIKTPLMSAYEAEILKKIGAKSLQEALDALRFQRLKKEGKIPENTELITKVPSHNDKGKVVGFSAKIGETYVKLSPPIIIVGEFEGEKYSTGYSTSLLDKKVRIENSYLFVGFEGKTTQNDVLDYFNNLIALLNVVFIPFDFVSQSDLLVQASGLGTTIEVISSSKAHCRGYGIVPIDISGLDFTRIVVAIQYLWGKIKKSKYFKDDNFFQLLGFGQHYYFHNSFFLAFIHTWMFLESCINVLWRELIQDSYGITGNRKKGTPLEDETNCTIQIKIEELFLKGAIDDQLRDELHSLRSRRNKVFHRDKKIKNRNVTENDARTAMEVGLKIFYMMIESELKDHFLAFAEMREKMWIAINRGSLHKIKKPKNKEQ